MEHEEYWKKRGEAAVLRGEEKVDKCLPELISAFEQAKKDLQKEVYAFYGRYAKNNAVNLEEAQKALNLAELREFRGRLKDFKKLAKESIGTFNLQVENLSVRARITRLQALLMEEDAILQRLYQEQKRQIEETVEKVYTESYYRRLFDIEQYTGFQQPFAQVSRSMVEAVLRYPVEGADISTRLWRQDMDAGFKVRETLNRMFLTGRPPQDFAKELQAVIGRRDENGKLTGKPYEAYRLLYNEASYAAGQAHLDAYRENGTEYYKLLETLDTKTCDQCGSLDGCVFSVEKGGDVPEEYRKTDTEYRRRAYAEHRVVTGVNYPIFHVGCRGTTIPYIPGLDESRKRRAARDPVTGKSVETKAKTYEEWMEKRLSEQQKDTVPKGRNSGKSEFDRQSEKPIVIETLDFSDKAEVKEKLLSYEKEAAGLDYEMDWTVTSDGRVWKTKGGSASVHPEQITELPDGIHLRGSYSYHNHPDRRTNYSLSAEDVGFFFEHEIQYSKASDSLYEYWIERQTDTPHLSFDTVLEEFKTCYNTVVRELAWKGEIDMDEDGYHTVVQYLSRKYHFIYERRKKNG